MMKQMTALAITALLAFTATQAFAADEFGPRFWNQTQAALGEAPEEIETGKEPMNNIMASDIDAAAEALQSIMPAAGEEANDDTNTEESAE